VAIRSSRVNGFSIKTSLLGDSGRASNGLSIGSTNRGLIKKNPLGHSGGGINYEDVDLELTLTPEESLRLTDLEKANGVTQYGDRVFVPYDKGADLIEENGNIVLPNYFSKIQFYVDWSPRAVHLIRNNRNARVQGAQHYFTDALTYSFLGFYSPTFRMGNGGVFDVGGSPVNSVFYSDKRVLIAILASRLLRFVFRAFLNHSINLQVEEVNASPLVDISRETCDELSQYVERIVVKQKLELSYDYASNEQLEIDRLVYEAYGLNEDDIREVENWYARRYPALAAAQRANLERKLAREQEAAS
jgi:hypothetical protein